MDKKTVQCRQEITEGNGGKVSGATIYRDVVLIDRNCREDSGTCTGEAVEERQGTGASGPEEGKGK